MIYRGLGVTTGINFYTNISIQMDSSPEFCVFDVVPSISAFDNGVNPHVEFSQIGTILLEFASGCGISVEVSGLTEEICSKTFMGVVEDAILVRVAKG